MAQTGEICSFPFTQLFLNPNGKITPCCYLAQEPFYTVGEIQRDHLKDVWNSPKMQELRREFLTGKPKICEPYIKAHKCNEVRKSLKEGIKLSEIMPYPMIRLDMMLNGQCNLECIMCEVWTVPKGEYNEQNFWAYGKDQIFPHLKELDIKGGEPFIQKDFYRLIEEVSAVNQTCLWHVTTNGHYRFNDKLRSMVDKIKIVRLSISIDSLDPKTFAKIRLKGTLATVLRTFDDWLEYKRQLNRPYMQINLNFVMQKANWHEVPDFVDFCKEKRISPFFIVLTHPSELSVLNLPVAEKKQIAISYIQNMRRQKDRVYFRLIRPILDSLSLTDREEILNQHTDAFFEMRKFGPSISEVSV